MHWRRKWQPTPVFLPGESQGQRSLVGCRLWGHRVEHDWSDLAAATAIQVSTKFIFLSFAILHVAFKWEVHRLFLVSLFLTLSTPFQYTYHVYFLNSSQIHPLSTKFPLSLSQIIILTNYLFILRPCLLTFYTLVSNGDFITPLLKIFSLFQLPQSKRPVFWMRSTRSCITCLSHFPSYNCIPLLSVCPFLSWTISNRTRCMPHAVLNTEDMRVDKNRLCSKERVALAYIHCYV